MIKYVRFSNKHPSNLSITSKRTCKMTNLTQTMNELMVNAEEQEEDSEPDDLVVDLVGSDNDSDCFGMDDDCFDFKDSDDEQENKETDDGNHNNVSSKCLLFEMLDEVPRDHSYVRKVFKPNDACVFACAMQSERTMMQKDLPEGVFVKMFENRLDLSTAMILGENVLLFFKSLQICIHLNFTGPPSTPYEDCLFFFDVSVTPNYPHSAPKVKYLSYSTQKLNPNLYANGLVCLSLLGTWPGSPEESWSAKKSTLLQLFVSIQGLILVSEPYYNEPAFHGRRGAMQTESAKYNGVAVKLVLETMVNQINKPPKSFREQVLDHYRVKGLELHDKINALLTTPNPPFPVSFDDSSTVPMQCLLVKFKDAVMKLVADTPDSPMNAEN